MGVSIGVCGGLPLTMTSLTFDTNLPSLPLRLLDLGGDIVGNV